MYYLVIIVLPCNYVKGICLIFVCSHLNFKHLWREFWYASLKFKSRHDFICLMVRLNLRICLSKWFYVFVCFFVLKKIFQKYFWRAIAWRAAPAMALQKYLQHTHQHLKHLQSPPAPLPLNSSHQSKHHHLGSSPSS